MTKEIRFSTASTDWIPVSKLPPCHRDQVLIYLENVNRFVIAKLWYQKHIALNLDGSQFEIESPLGWVYYDIGGKNTIDFPLIKYWMPLIKPPEF